MKKMIVKIVEVKLVESQLMIICDELGINDRIEKADLLKVKSEYNKLAKENGIELEFVR